ncbi:MAG: hypothetical protein J2P54_06565 [Bradyrhizobiaceae bacterium]|nr:hypothetical protein [Bradyrhizobiaceae bacterium]
MSDGKVVRLVPSQLAGLEDRRMAALERSSRILPAQLRRLESARIDALERMDAQAAFDIVMGRRRVSGLWTRTPIHRRHIPRLDHGFETTCNSPAGLG